MSSIEAARMDVRTAELVRCMEWTPRSPRGLGSLRDDLLRVRASLTARGERAALLQLAERLLDWAFDGANAVRAEALVEIAELLVRDLGHREGPTRLYELALSLAPLDFSITNRAREALGSQAFDRVEWLYLAQARAVERTRGASPEHRALAVRRLADLRAEAGSVSAAISSYEKLVEVAPDLSSVRRLAELLTERGDPGDADDAEALFSLMQDLGAPRPEPRLASRSVSLPPPVLPAPVVAKPAAPALPLASSSLAAARTLAPATPAVARTPAPVALASTPLAAVPPTRTPLVTVEKPSLRAPDPVAAQSPARSTALPLVIPEAQASARPVQPPLPSTRPKPVSPVPEVVRADEPLSAVEFVSGASPSADTVDSVADALRGSARATAPVLRPGKAPWPMDEAKLARTLDVKITLLVPGSPIPLSRPKPRAATPKRRSRSGMLRRSLQVLAAAFVLALSTFGFLLTPIGSGLFIVLYGMRHRPSASETLQPLEIRSQAAVAADSPPSVNDVATHVADSMPPPGVPVVEALALPPRAVEAEPVLLSVTARVKRVHGGTMNPKSLRASLDRAMLRASRCELPATSTAPNQALALTWLIASTGRVQWVRSEGRPRPAEREAQTCVTAALEKARFPRPRGGAMRVDGVLSLRTRDGAAPLVDG